MPVLIHQADPYGFFEPVIPENEHYESLIKFPSWSFGGQEFPGKMELLKRRDNLVKSHPGTIFILPTSQILQRISGMSQNFSTKHQMFTLISRPGWMRWDGSRTQPGNSS